MQTVDAPPQIQFTTLLPFVGLTRPETMSLRLRDPAPSLGRSNTLLEDVTLRYHFCNSRFLR